MVGVRVKRRAVSHRLGTVAYRSCAVGKPRVRVNRLFAVLVLDFKLVVEEHRVLAKRGFCGVVDIGKQAALKRFSGHGVKPS